MRRALLGAGLAAAVLMLTTATSAVAHTFDGGCQLKATVSFTPALNALPQNITWTVTNGGTADTFSIEGQTGIAPFHSSTCSGTLDGHTYNGPVTVSGSGSGLLSCDVGNLAGVGALTFTGAKHSPQIRYWFSTPYVLRFPLYQITGMQGGNAYGTTEFWTTKNPSGFTNCVEHGQLTPTTPATAPHDGVPSAMFEAFIRGTPGGISG